MVTPYRFGPDYEDHNPRVPFHLWKAGDVGERWFADHMIDHGFTVEGFDPNEAGVPDGTVGGLPVEVKTVQRPRFDDVAITTELLEELHSVDGLYIAVVQAYPGDNGWIVRGPWGAPWDHVRGYLSDVQTPAYEGGTPYVWLPKTHLVPCLGCRRG